ncbi:MAG: hypothetical protein ACM3JG_16415 [Thiohalocapsa sp.]
MSSLCAGLLVLALLTAPNAQLADCASAADRFAAAARRALEAARNYESCVSSSATRSDCAAEMQALDDAHDAFTEAVADAKACQ